MTFEWTKPDKRSIQQVMSGMSLERFPLLERCLEKKAPVSLSREGKGEGGLKEPWRFTAFPLIREGRVDGFLCVENAREHPGDAALFGALIPYMLLERERFRQGCGGADSVGDLLEKPNRRSYNEIVKTLTSERYSSLGAVCLDLLYLGENGSAVAESSGKLLWYVAKTLTDLFGAALSFRVWETEFVAFFPNTTREVFIGRCGRLRSILQRRYPKQVRIGRAWAQDAFTGVRLVDEARAAMKGSSGTLAAGIQEFAEKSALHAPRREQKEQRFTVYFQPKLDYAHRKSCPVRRPSCGGIAEDGSIVLPSQFIEFLEEEGAIRELDLMVLECSLAQMSQWKRPDGDSAGFREPFPGDHCPSFHPGIGACHTKPVCQTFPRKPWSWKSPMGGENVDNEELRRIVEQYHACGLRLSLDDFGSKYANLPFRQC